jgi:hypothetical protein
LNGLFNPTLKEILPMHRLNPRRALTALAALGATLALCGTLASLASASFVESLQVVHHAGSFDSGSEKSAVAICPKGKFALGGGAELTPLSTLNAGVTQLIPGNPTDALKSSQSTVREFGFGTTESWGVGADAICAKPLPGLERVLVHSVTDSAPSKGAIVHCPAGKGLVSAGASLSAVSGHVVLDDVTPNADLTSVTVKAFEDEQGTSANWTVFAYAMCATGQPFGLERVTATGTSDSTTFKAAFASCSDGKRVIGGGGDIVHGNGRVAFESLTPADFPGVQTEFIASAHEIGDAPDDWQLTAYALCALVS